MRVLMFPFRVLLCIGFALVLWFTFAVGTAIMLINDLWRAVK